MEIILYSNHCPQCRVLEAKLKEKCIVYEEENDVELMIAKGFNSMPMLEVDNEVMTYAKSLEWIKTK